MTKFINNLFYFFLNIPSRSIEKNTYKKEQWNMECEHILIK